VGLNVGEKNAIMDTFVFIIGETALLQVLLQLPMLLTWRTMMGPAEDA
jgi:hypothetical protein